jgi:hypothetical protein
MRIALRYTVFSILSVLILMPVFVSAQTNPGSARDRNTEQTTRKPDEKSTQSGDRNKGQIDDEGIVFPDVENWQRGESRTYSEPALGYSVPYVSKDGSSVSVFVYNGGNNSISDGIGDKVTKAEMSSIRERLIKLGEMGVYQNAKEVKNETVTLGGTNGKIQALHLLFTFRIQGADVESDLYLFGYKNNFIKIHATRPKGSADNKAFASLLAAMDNLFSK